MKASGLVTIAYKVRIPHYAIAEYNQNRDEAFRLKFDTIEDVISHIQTIVEKHDVIFLFDETPFHGSPALFFDFDQIAGHFVGLDKILKDRNFLIKVSPERGSTPRNSTYAGHEITLRDKVISSTSKLLSSTDIRMKGIMEYIIKTHGC